MIEAISTMLHGLRLIVQEPTLRAVLWRIVLLLVALLALVMVGVHWLATEIVQMLLPDETSGLWFVLASLFTWIFALLLSGMSGVLCFSVLAGLASAPWLELLAIRAEQLVGIHLTERNLNWPALMAQSVASLFWPTLKLLFFGVVALLALLLPLLGPPVAAIIWFYAVSRFLLWEMLDTPASRRGWSYSRREQELNRQPFYYLTLGLLASALMFVPLLNILVLPAGVAALSQRLPTDYLVMTTE